MRVRQGRIHGVLQQAGGEAGHHRRQAQAVRLLAKDARLAVKKPDACRWVEDDLYKGGIAKMMRPWKRRPAVADWPTKRIEAALRRTPISRWGDKLPNRIGGGGGFRRLSGEERCWAARERLRDAGFKTVGAVADLTEKRLLAAPGIGRETVGLTRWMLQEIGLDLAA